MGEQAINLCTKIGYSSAGTIEFLVDINRNFYFLEMNTRLQVEHPITECTTGIDLVEQMIRIASGQKLEIKQTDVKINGWAIESRVYAEDPYKHFGLPSIGKLYKYIEPKSLPGVRCDSGIQEGSEISIYYDPLICKLVCHGETREEAIKRSIAALDSYVIRGVTNNIPLLRDILANENFAKGSITTNFLSENYPNEFTGIKLKYEDKMKLLTIASALYATEELRSREYLNAPKLLIHAKAKEKWELVVSLENENIDVKISQSNNSFKICIDENEYTLTIGLNLATPIIKPVINGETLTAQLLSKCATGEFHIM